MRKGIVICGPICSGKTFLVKGLVSERSVVWLNGRDKTIVRDPFAFQKITEATTAIVVDDLKIENRSLELLFDLIGETIIVHKQSHPVQEVTNNATIVVTTTTPFEKLMKLGNSFHRRFNVVEINKCSMSLLNNKEVQNG